MGPGALPGTKLKLKEGNTIVVLHIYIMPPGSFSNNIAGPAGIMSGSSGGTECNCIMS